MILICFKKIDDVRQWHIEIEISGIYPFTVVIIFL